nr:transcription initiation factor IIB [Candidatus Sigynarchaeota archaeon]
AAALYLASVLEKERRTQRDIAKIAQVTEVTVRNRFKELISKLNINIADE